VDKKITEEMDSAVDNLERSIKALEKGDQKKFGKLVWQAASELEYTLFLFSVKYGNKIEGSSWNPRLSELDIEPAVVEARDSVEEAKNSINDDEVSEAYKKTWKARGRLLKLQKILEKRRKSKSKK
jgi:hypothetical protein